MSEIQLVQCLVSWDQTAVVTDPPVTYPEYLVIRHIHGAEHVTDACETGKVERELEDERKRLKNKYGDDLINSLFPGALAQLPARGDLPLVEDVLAANRAAEEARAKVKAAAKAKRTAAVPGPAPVLDPKAL